MQDLRDGNWTDGKARPHKIKSSGAQKRCAGATTPRRVGANEEGKRSGFLFLLLLIPVVDDLFEPRPRHEHDVVWARGGERVTARSAHLSLLSSSGWSCFSRAVSVCMNLLNGVSFLRPAVDDRPVWQRDGSVRAYGGMEENRGAHAS